MTLSDPRRITDELLSAYIDDEVTEQERAIVEAAIAADEEIAWRVNSLRQTVSFLHELPELALPRSFVLTLDQVRAAQSDESLVVAGMAERVPATPQRKTAPIPEAEGGFWAEVAEGWRRFWQGGNPVLRNAAAVSFALMLVVASGGQLINRAVTQPAGMMATAREAMPVMAPASESAANVAADNSAAGSAAAPSAESAALAPPTVEATAAKTADTESLQEQADSAGEAPAPESARIMQSQAEPSSDASAANSPEGDEAASALTMSEAPAESAEAAIAESAPAEGEAAPTEEAVVAAAAAVPAEEAVEESTAEESMEGDAPTDAQAAEAEMAAPAAAPMPMTGEDEPPLVANPGPGMGGGGEGARPESGGGGMGSGGGSGPEGAPPPSNDGALVPQQAYGFDVDATSAPTMLPPEETVEAAEEAVSESVEAANASEVAPADSVADVAVTPAVEAVEAEAATANEIEPTATPEAVALVAPGAITSSEVVENVGLDEGVAASGEGSGLPVLLIAQASMLLLTVLFASLWWRSRKSS